jgi:hypothetical protein
MNHKKVIGHIANSHLKADLLTSKLPSDILSIKGFSSHKIRHLLNNLMEYDGVVNYLEVGTFRGSTFASSLYNNNLNSAYAVDNFKQFPDYGDNKKAFDDNLKGQDYVFLEEDSFSLDLEKIKHPINFYLYDGHHSYESHYKAVEYYYPALNDEFVLIVDDYDPHPDWIFVSEATQDAIRDLGLKKIHELHIKSQGRNHAPSWWNGYYVAFLSK